MSVSPVWRRIARHFSISAPRMAVRTHLGWPWKAVFAAALVALVGGMLWWWGFDFGQLFGGLHRQEVERQMETARADAQAARAEASALRMANSQLDSDLAMMRGLQVTLARQVGELQAENAAMKEEVAFLQSFFEGAAKPGLAIQRLAVERNGGDVARFSVLVVRGGNPKTDFDGHVVLSVDLAPNGAAGDAGPRTLTFPSEASPGPALLALKFKYYQRLEGTFQIPAGYALRAVTARAYEAGSTAPRATRALTLP